MSPDLNEFDRNGDCGKEVKILFKSSKFKVTDVQIRNELRMQVAGSPLQKPVVSQVRTVSPTSLKPF